MPSPAQARAAAANVAHRVLYGHFADLRPTARSLIAQGPNRSVYRYERTVSHRQRRRPAVLLVPPLAAPALCFDLRRGCSLAQHLVDRGERTYLLDYGDISFADRHLGIESFVHDVVPAAIRSVARDTGGTPVHVVGWCLGGIFSLLAAAADPDLPIATVTAVASPFDVTAVPMVAPLRPLVRLTGGRILTGLYRSLGGAPTPLVRAAYQLSGADKYLTKPLAILTHLDDRDFLAQIEAVDHFTANMLAYPGRAFGQLYHRFFRANDLAAGQLDLDGRRLDLADVRVPVLAIAGSSDTIAPVASVRRLTGLLPGSPQVRFEIAPGGHLGVLTGRGARATTWTVLGSFFDDFSTAKAA